MEKLILKKGKWGYKKIGVCTRDDSLMLINRFLISDIGPYNPPIKSKEELIEDITSGRLGGFNFCDIEVENNKIHINTEYYDDVEDLVLSPEQLKYILYKWWELTEAGYKEIIITKHDDGSYTLEGRNPKLIKEEKQLSFFGRLLKTIFRR